MTRITPMPIRCWRHCKLCRSCRAKAGEWLSGRFAGEERGTETVGVLLSSIGAPVHPDPLGGATADVARELIARAWWTYVESLAARGPVVALFEDIHWADPSLLDLLETLAARVAAPVLFVKSTKRVSLPVTRAVRKEAVSGSSSTTRPVSSSR